MRSVGKQKLREESKIRSIREIRVQESGTAQRPLNITVIISSTNLRISSIKLLTINYKLSTNDSTDIADDAVRGDHFRINDAAEIHLLDDVLKSNTVDLGHELGI